MTSGTRPNVPNVAQVEMIYTASNERVENVYHVQGTSGWDDASLTLLVAAFSSWETATARALRHDGIILVLMRAWDMTTPTGAAVEITASTVGTNATGHLPNNVTASVKHNTGLRGRSFRGRTYWIGLAKGDIDTSGQSLTNTAATNITSALETLRTTVFPNGGKLGVVSLVSGGAYRPVGLFSPTIQMVMVDQYIDSQRRRLIGHNRHH